MISEFSLNLYEVLSSDLLLVELGPTLGGRRAGAGKPAAPRTKAHGGNIASGSTTPPFLLLHPQHHSPQNPALFQPQLAPFGKP